MKQIKSKIITYRTPKARQLNQEISTPSKPNKQTTCLPIVALRTVKATVQSLTLSSRGSRYTTWNSVSICYSTLVHSRVLGFWFWHLNWSLFRGWFGLRLWSWLLSWSLSWGLHRLLRHYLWCSLSRYTVRLCTKR